MNRMLTYAMTHDEKELELRRGNGIHRVIKEYTLNGSFSVDYYFRLLEEAFTDQCHMIIGWNTMFGHLMFIDNEIQITERDFQEYHRVLGDMGQASNADNILVVGDGDGGFTLVPWARRVTYVEYDPIVMQAGEKYFGADWSIPKATHVMSFEDWYKKHGKGGLNYETIIFAITDDFMRGPYPESVSDALNLLHMGGRIVLPVGCELDVTTASNELRLRESFPTITWTTHKHYFPGFFSNYVVCVGYKGTRAKKKG